MRWRESCPPVGRWARGSAGLATALLLAGCFQPLYSEHSLTGGPGVHQSLSQVDIEQINAPANSPEARLAVLIRNNLLFDFNGGGAAPAPAYRLKITISGSRIYEATDPVTALPSIEGYTLRASYILISVANGGALTSGTAATNVSYDTMGSQRFARYSGLQDAEKRAAKVLSDNITARLASHFMAGT